MGNRAFEILGIAPTDDGRAIRAAFLRLARIYHPDRFLEMPEDVRSEAERRMKEATSAYEYLRAQAPEARAPQPIDDDEIKKRARQYRENIEAKRAIEESDRARWRRWDDVERKARKKAEVEAEVAARIAAEVDGRYEHKEEPRLSAPQATPLEGGNRPNRDLLGERLAAARRGETNPLVPRRAQHK